MSGIEFPKIKFKDWQKPSCYWDNYKHYICDRKDSTFEIILHYRDKLNQNLHVKNMALLIKQHKFHLTFKHNQTH